MIKLTSAILSQSQMVSKLVKRLKFSQNVSPVDRSLSIIYSKIESKVKYCLQWQSKKDRPIIFSPNYKGVDLLIVCPSGRHVEHKGDKLFNSQCTGIWI
jgi:hypothetical protein